MKYCAKSLMGIVDVPSNLSPEEKFEIWKVKQNFIFK